ncbi:MAG: Ig-like domain-containing protein [Alphaproteobacteria bacterium]
MIYDVRDYGALGDGVTNDTSAIQAAVNAARDAGGGEVYIPTGTYIVTGNPTNPSAGCIMLYNNVTVYGDGMGETTVKLQDGWSTKITGIFRTQYGVENHDIGMHDLSIDGNRATATNKVDGFFCGVAPGQTGTDTNITLDKVEIMNCSGYGFDPHERTTNMTISNCVAHGNGLDGFTLDYLINSNIVNNLSYGNDRHGFNIVTTTHDTTLTGNIAHHNGGEGIMVQRGSEDIPGPYNITITGGSSYSNTLDGISVTMSVNVTIDGVDIHDNLQRGIRIRGSVGTVIENCFLHNNSQGKHLGYDEISISNYDDSAGISRKIFKALNTLIKDNIISESGAVTAAYSIKETGSDVDYTTVIANFVSGTKNNNLPLFVGIHSVFDPNYPIAQNDDFFSGINQTVTGNVLSNNGNGMDNDPDGNPLSVASFSGATANGGNVVLNANGSFSYTPPSGFAGNDSFSYTLLDGLGGTDTGTVTIAVGGVPINHPPEAVSDRFNDVFNQVLTGNVMANNGNGADNDPEGDALSVIAFSGTTAGGGSIVLNADGSFTYTPAADFTGADSFSYTLRDSQGGTDTATVSITMVAPSGALLGTSGDDTISSGSQAHVVYGAAGDDNLNGGGGNDTLYGGIGRDSLNGGDGGDILYGGNGDDDLTGGKGDDILYGDVGNDVSHGNSGNDTLYGGAGADVLYGDSDADTLVAGAGNTTMTGGGGSDTFKVAEIGYADVITDFRTSGGDRIDISDLLQGYDPGDALSEFVAAARQGNTTILSVDADGAAGGSNFTAILTLQGVSNFDVNAMVSQGYLIV